MSEDKKQPTNEFRIGIKTKPKELITQCETLLKDEKVKDLHLSAVGNSIGELVSIVEILKSMYPNLFLKTLFSTIEPTTNKNKEKKAEPKKLMPRLEIILSTEKIVEKNEDSVKMSEDERQILIDTLEKRKERYLKRRKLFRRPFRTNRKWGYNTRKQRYSYSAKRTGYNNKRYGFSNVRRPYARNPIRKKINVRKFNGTKKNTGNKQAVTVKS